MLKVTHCVSSRSISFEIRDVADLFCAREPSKTVFGLGVLDRTSPRIREIMTEPHGAA